MPAEKILVVEDDMALLEGLRDILMLAGFQVTTAMNGVEGLAALERSLPDLILSDIMMPKLDGYQFYAQVRARPEWISLPFIFLTAKGEKTDIRQGKQLGADDYITKPFEEEDLLVAIRSKLARRAQLDAIRDQQIADLKRTILTTLNHEFRTPLTYITAYTEVMRQSDSDLQSDEFKNFMRGIQVGSQRLRQLVEDFILLVELQTGEAQQSYERRREIITDLPALLQRVLQDYAPRAAARKVGLVADIPASLPAILADPEYLSSAVGRLMDNAIKFSKKRAGEEGQVTLRACGASAGGSVILQVKDEGIGIRAEELSKLFDMFHQIDRAKMEQQGSGSGLAITRGIVTMHGGTLTAVSEYGLGSTFTIELPAV